MTAVLKDDTELFKQFSDNESFKRWLTDTIFGLTYDEPKSPGIEHEETEDRDSSRGSHARE